MFRGQYIHERNRHHDKRSNKRVEEMTFEQVEDDTAKKLKK